MPVQPKSDGPYIKGVVASNQPLAQPKGSVPRASNLILSSRGAWTPCDGSAELFEFNGQVQTGRGKVLAMYLFCPTGVSSYYLALIQALDIPLGPPNNLSVTTAAGGTLPAATYFYKVTAIDGVGGETTATNEASVGTGANGKNTLTWNIVPNAAGYNVYRSTSSGTESLMVGKNLPVAQNGFGSLTVSFVDDGTDTVSIPLAASSGVITQVMFHIDWFYTATFTLSAAANITAGTVFTYSPGSNSLFNPGVGAWVVDSVLTSTQFTAHFSVGSQIGGLIVGSSTTGGSVLPVTSPPASGTTQQIALFKMPILAGANAAIPIPYTDLNIVALFPASLTSFATVTGGGGGSGGGGGTGGGGNTGGGGGGGRNFV